MSLMTVYIYKQKHRFIVEEVMTEKEKIKLITEDMWCNKYSMECGEVPYEVLNEEIFDLTGLGFSNYECDLLCRDCEFMKEF